MSEENGTTSSEIKTPIGSLSFSGKRVAEFIAILSLSLMGVLAYAFYEHKQDAKLVGSEMVMAVKEMTKAQQDSAIQQRITNCIISLPQDRRETALATCERIAR